MVLIERPRIMTFEQSEKPGLKRKLAHEFKELVWIFLARAGHLDAEPLISNFRGRRGRGGRVRQNGAKTASGASVGPNALTPIAPIGSSAGCASSGRFFDSLQPWDAMASYSDSLIRIS